MPHYIKIILFNYIIIIFNLLKNFNFKYLIYISLYIFNILILI